MQLSGSNNRNRRVAAAVVVIITGLLLSACSGSTNQPATSAAADSKSTLAQIIKAGVIKVGFCVGYPPYGFSDVKGNPAGFDIDLAQAYADSLGVKLELIEVTSPSRIPSLETKQVDLVSCAFTANDERRQKIDFSDPTLAQGQSLLVLKESPITSVADLSGKKVAVNKGGTGGAIAKAANPKVILLQYDSDAVAVLAVANGQADATVNGATQAKVEAAKNPNLKILIDGDVGPKSYYAIGLRKNQPELLLSLNKFMREWHHSGDDVKLWTKWVKYPPTYEMTGLPSSID